MNTTDDNNNILTIDYGHLAIDDGYIKLRNAVRRRIEEIRKTTNDPNAVLGEIEIWAQLGLNIEAAQAFALDKKLNTKNLSVIDAVLMVLEGKLVFVGGINVLPVEPIEIHFLKEPVEDPFDGFSNGLSN